MALAFTKYGRPLCRPYSEVHDELTPAGTVARLLFCHSGLDPWFDRLTTLSKVEGESSVFPESYATGCRIGLALNSIGSPA